MPRVELPTGVELFYTDDGDRDAPCILLVHGWACDSHDWSWQLPELARDHRVVAVDLRGHGRSSVPASGYAPGDFASDLAELVRALETGPVIAVGHSMGALIVRVLAVESPELVRAVVVIDPSYGLPDDVVPLLAAALEPMRGADGQAVAAAQFAAIEGPDTPSWLKTWHLRRMLGTPQHVLVEAFAALWVGPDALGGTSRTQAYLSRRACPVLAAYVQSRADTAAWEATISNAPLDRVFTVAAGHWLHQEEPSTVNSAIGDWAATLPQLQAAR